MTVKGRPSRFTCATRCRSGSPTPDIQRITFNEITPKAIREAVAHPGTIDMSKVNAQKARRVLDRIVGLLPLPAPVEEGEERPFRGPRAVGGAAA